MSDEYSLPIAVLYTWPSSVWSTVPRLCLHEKGYSEDEYMLKFVDISKGENFSPSYLKLNKNGTVPTFVVPTLETIGGHVDTRYRTLRDTVTICEFLDQARSAQSLDASFDRPAPTLSPATIDAKALSDSVIELIHLPTVDPNFIAISALDADDLEKKSRDGPGKSLSARRSALQKYIVEARKSALKSSVSAREGSMTYEERIVKFLEDKLRTNEEIWELYNGKASEERKNQFYDISKQAWTKHLPAAIEKLDAIIKGPFVLGDQLSLADLHTISWLTRIISIADGTPHVDGIVALEKKTRKPVGDKLRKFWELWVERESFKEVLVPSCSAFREMK